MKHLIFAAATTIALATSVHSAGTKLEEATPGLIENGIVINGRVFNGIELQGLTSQGLQGQVASSAAINPFAGLDRAPLGQ